MVIGNAPLPAVSVDPDQLDTMVPVSVYKLELTLVVSVVIFQHPVDVDTAKARIGRMALASATSVAIRDRMARRLRRAERDEPSCRQSVIK
jgi:hypothetical protein